MSIQNLQNYLLYNDLNFKKFPRVLLSTHKVFFHTSYMYGAECPLTKQKYLGFRLVFSNPKNHINRPDYEWVYLEVTREAYTSLVFGGGESADSNPQFDAVAYLREHLFSPTRENVFLFLKREELNYNLDTVLKLNIRVHDVYNTGARWRGSQAHNTPLNGPNIWYRAIGVLPIPIKCLYKSLQYASYRGTDLIPLPQHCE